MGVRERWGCRYQPTAGRRLFEPPPPPRGLRFGLAGNGRVWTRVAERNGGVFTSMSPFDNQENLRQWDLLGSRRAKPGRPSRRRRLRGPAGVEVVESRVLLSVVDP